MPSIGYVNSLLFVERCGRMKKIILERYQRPELSEAATMRRNAHLLALDLQIRYADSMWPWNRKWKRMIETLWRDVPDLQRSFMRMWKEAGRVKGW